MVRHDLHLSQISSVYKLLLRPFFFLFQAEKAHYLTMNMFAFLSGIPGMTGLFRLMFSPNRKDLGVEAFGLKFKNPVGLAAGFDKDGRYIRPLSLLGFGFIEVGTVTPKPQDGNPRPRLFRLKKSEALINRMGFNNRGCDALVERLKKVKKSDVVIGANIGKNKVTPNEKAVDDYLYCFEKLFPYVDYFVVNVSSPNTPNLRELQERKPLTQLLSAIQSANKAKLNRKPVLLKIAPDVTEGQLKDIVEIIQETETDGLITTNTTISREGLAEDNETVATIGAGGLSGAPVYEKSNDILRSVVELSGNAFPVVGVGGIFKADQARAKLYAGAKLVQLYTGFVYEGPACVKRIIRGL